MEYSCSMCPFLGRNAPELLFHLVKKHRHDSNFIVHCSYEGCGASYRNYKSFKVHCSRKHFLSPNDTANTEYPSTNDNDDENDAIADVNYDSNELSEGKFLLKLLAKHRISQKAVIDIIDTTRDLFEEKMIIIKESISRKFGIKEDALDESFKASTFNKLKTESQQESLFKTLGLIKPKSAIMSTKLVNCKVKGRFKFVRKNVMGYYVPFREQLEALINMLEVNELLHDGQQSTNN